MEKNKVLSTEEAYHEAGHAVVGYYIMYKPSGLSTLEREAIELLAGSISKQYFFEEANKQLTDLDKQDWAKARKILKRSAKHNKRLEQENLFNLLVYQTESLIRFLEPLIIKLANQMNNKSTSRKRPSEHFKGY